MRQAHLKTPAHRRENPKKDVAISRQEAGINFRQIYFDEGNTLFFSPK